MTETEFISDISEEFLAFVGAQIVIDYEIINFLFPLSDLRAKLRDASIVIKNFYASKTTKQKLEALKGYFENTSFVDLIQDAEIAVYSKIYVSKEASAHDLFTIFSSSKYPGFLIKNGSFALYMEYLKNWYEFKTDDDMIWLGDHPRLDLLEPVLKWFTNEINLEFYPDLYKPIKEELDTWLIQDLAKILIDYL